SVDPKNGPVKSRHIIVYAGKPDKKKGRDNDQLKQIKKNFAGEKNTTVHGVGGDGNSPWSYPGTKAGLEKALKKVKEDMNKKGVDPKKEQFILFVTDHGGRRDIVTTTVQASTAELPQPIQVEPQVVAAMYEQSDNIPTLTFTIHQETQPGPCYADVGSVEWINIYLNNIEFPEPIDINGNGIFEPEDGWRATVFLDETTLFPGEPQVVLVGGLYNLDGTPIPDGTELDIGLGTGAIGKVPWQGPILVERPCGELTLLENDPSPMSYTLLLQEDPGGPCEIEILTDGQVEVFPPFVEVDPSNWHQPIDIQVFPIDDALPQGGPGALPRPSEINHLVNCPGNPLLDQTPLFVDAFIIDDEQYCGQVGTIYSPADVNRDCQVNLADLAITGSEWLRCTLPGDPGCFDQFPGIGIVFDPEGSSEILYLGSPHNAGLLEPGDIILDFMGTPVADGQGLRLAIESGPVLLPGQPVEITLDRNGVTQTVIPFVEMISTMTQYQHSCGGSVEQVLVHDTGRYFVGLNEPGEYVCVRSQWMTVEPDGSVTSRTRGSDTSEASFEGDSFLVK
ncbi:MAG: hypothetical protein KAS23_01490, partial [Anaerohalosphaera sp.]|nr:hypothetical protein [Anaerohalosphaera sp.]